MSNTQTKRLQTVSSLAKLYPGVFSEASLRWLIFNEKKNGFSMCLRRIGRRVLIDVDAFEQWIDSNKSLEGAR